MGVFISFKNTVGRQSILKKSQEKRYVRIRIDKVYLVLTSDIYTVKLMFLYSTVSTLKPTQAK